MKFDLVLCNPPYQKSPNCGSEVWSAFNALAFSLAPAAGRVAMIHPSGWRCVGPAHSKSMAACRRRMREIDVDWIRMLRPGDPAFGVGVPIDVWSAAKSSTEGHLTEIEGMDGVRARTDLKTLGFIPNSGFERRGDEVILSDLVAEEGEERVEIIYNAAYNHYNSSISGDPWVSHEREGKFDRPVVFSIRASGPKMHWADRDRGHYGSPKVMVSAWHKAGVPILDPEGKYAMSQHVMGIVDAPENLPKIAEAVQTAAFARVMDDARIGQNDWNVFVMKTFRKDFWKEFV